MKSSINIRYNVYVPKAELLYSLEQTRLLGHVNTNQRCEIQCEALEFREEHKPNRRSTVCNDETVRRLFNLHIAIIYHGFTVVTLTAEMWDIHTEFYYRSKVI